MGPKLETRQGLLRGADEEGICVFRGVPFAAPPVGALRFQPPIGPEPWSGMRDATMFGPSPPQPADPLGRMLGLAPAATDEDCLTLNVWTPGLDDTRRPILFWIHGGAFATGTGSTPLYDGRRLASRGDVVVVTLNYRVGVLGFAALAGAANLGLQDQVAALRWVREHATRLGGDPSRITVFGESAGAGSIVSLLAMPAARGLFRRAIVQSPAPDGMIDAADARRRAETVAEKLGLSADDLASLQAAPVKDLIEAQSECMAGGVWATGMFCAPVIDGSVLPRRPLEAIRDGSCRDVDLVIGTTADEMKLYSIGADPDAMSDELAGKIVSAQVRGEAPDGRPRGEVVLEHYRDAYPDVSAGDLYARMQTDLSMRIPAIAVAEAQVELGGRAFMYDFTWASRLADGTAGACHAIDLPFTLGNLDAPGMREFAGAGPDADRLAADVMDAWCAFARSGEPGHEGIGAWNVYETERRATMSFGVPSRVCEAPCDADRALWSRLGWP